MNYMRNKQTGEVREVEEDSPEFITLKGQVGPEGRSLWEQTGDHAVDAIAARAEAGSLREEDLGAQDQPLAPLKQDVSATEAAHEPWKDLTAAEREAGLTEKSKAREQAEEQNAKAAQERTATLEEAAERLSGDGTPEGFPIEGAEEVPEDASKADLQAEAEVRGLSTSGSKADIRARIEDHDNQTATA